MSFPSPGPRRGVQLDDIVTGLGLLGNVLALPHTVEAQQNENEQMKALLAGSGIPQAQIDAATPEPALRWLSPKQGGFTGKVLGGVGDVGAILSSVVGKPVKAPRMGLDEIASAAKLRAAAAKDRAEQDLANVIADPKSTDRQIGLAAVRAGNTDAGLRYLHGAPGTANQPTSIFAARRMLNDPSLTPERRQEIQGIVDDAEAAQRQHDKELSDLIQGRQPPHYDPAESEQLRHGAITQERDAEARRRNYQPGSPEYKQYMDFGHDLPPRAPKADKTLQDYIDEEGRRDAAASRQLGYKPPTESVQDRARRRMDADAKAKADAAAGRPIEQPIQRGAPSVTVTPTSPPGAKPPGKGGEGPPSTTAGPTAGAPPGPDTSDAWADDILSKIQMEDLPPDVQQQVHAASAAGMPKGAIANWLLSLQPQAQQPGPLAPPR